MKNFKIRSGNLGNFLLNEEFISSKSDTPLHQTLSATLISISSCWFGGRSGSVPGKEVPPNLISDATLSTESSETS
jgi:hypothetical protein